MPHTCCSPQWAGMKKAEVHGPFHLKAIVLGFCLGLVANQAAHSKVNTSQVKQNKVSEAQMLHIHFACRASYVGLSGDVLQTKQENWQSLEKMMAILITRRYY